MGFETYEATKEFFRSVGDCTIPGLYNDSANWLQVHYHAPGYGKWLTLSMTAFSVIGQLWAGFRTAKAFWSRWGWMVTGVAMFFASLTLIPAVMRKFRASPLADVVLKALAGECRVDGGRVTAGKVSVAAGSRDDWFHTPWTSSYFDVRIGDRVIERMLSKRERKRIWKAARKVIDPYYAAIKQVEHEALMREVLSNA